MLLETGTRTNTTLLAIPTVHNTTVIKTTRLPTVSLLSIVTMSFYASHIINVLVRPTRVYPQESCGPLARLGSNDETNALLGINTQFKQINDKTLFTIGYGLNVHCVLRVNIKCLENILKYKCIHVVRMMFDFDAASAAWKKDTLADDPKALRRKQIKYWKMIADKERGNNEQITTTRKRKRPVRYGFE